MDSEKILAEINKGATWLNTWSHAHTFTAGLIIGVSIGLLLGIVF